MSVDVRKFLSQFGLSKETALGDEFATNDSTQDILDLSQIKFDNDETWLYEVPKSSKFIVSASISMKHQTENIYQDMNSRGSHIKNINTQTFTRPKKKFLRPSIEKFNQEIFGDTELNMSSSPESPSFLNKTLTKDQIPSKPLEFDLSQPETSNSVYFYKLAANADNEETFQNMSPPSLVNSMCSSTFTNLMESSFIKDDPVLKQICDTDFTTSILSQCSEPPSLIQSLNYGTNSIDEFLTHVSQDETMRLKSMELNGCAGDASFIVHRNDSLEEDKKTTFEENYDGSEADNTEHYSQSNYNGTYRKSNRLSSATFRKTDFNRLSARNHTYEIDPNDVKEAQNVMFNSESPKSNKTIATSNNDTYMKRNSLENSKNRTVIKDSCNNDLDRYDLKDVDVDCLNTKSDSQKSLGCSIGSADSLDRISTLSSSSKGSNKFLNLEEVEAIAEKQERSLHVMSTPKPNWSNKCNRIIWDDNVISPIVATEMPTDSGESSDEYKSVNSTISAKNSGSGSPVKQTRSLVSLQNPSDVRKLKSINTLVKQSNLHKVPSRVTSNYQKVNTVGPKVPQMRVSSTGSINSNLKSMRPSLKGSYTSLKPVNTYLPVAPPINAPLGGSNTTYLAPVIANTRTQEIKIMKSQSVEICTGDGVFLKPAEPIRSGLPKRIVPSTGIPRPVSKIPGLKRFNSLKQDP